MNRYKHPRPKGLLPPSPEHGRSKGKLAATSLTKQRKIRRLRKARQALAKLFSGARRG